MIVPSCTRSAAAAAPPPPAAATARLFRCCYKFSYSYTPDTTKTYLHSAKHIPSGKAKFDCMKRSYSSLHLDNSYHHYRTCRYRYTLRLINTSIIGNGHSDHELVHHQGGEIVLWEKQDGSDRPFQDSYFKYFPG